MIFTRNRSSGVPEPVEVTEGRRSLSKVHETFSLNGRATNPVAVSSKGPEDFLSVGRTPLSFGPNSCCGKRGGTRNRIRLISVLLEPLSITYGLCFSFVLFWTVSVVRIAKDAMSGPLWTEDESLVGLRYKH